MAPMSGKDTKLIVIAGATQGTEVPLREDPVLLGRGSDCDLPLLDNYASRHHCWIEPREDGWWVRDLGSKNGTLVGTARVEHEYELKDGEIITIGHTQIRFSDPGATKTYNILSPVSLARLEVDVPGRMVRVDGIAIDPPLSPKQWLLLRVLWENRGQALSKDTIASAVWPEAEGAIFDYQIDKLVSRLRARLGPLGEELIETIWGFGYKLK
ncbi:MAG: FHA domain-containing protein [Ardenticatenales bacterium]|nr:FHA domain-containing protein [Ardenticatenales bacterium]